MTDANGSNILSKHALENGVTRLDACATHQDGLPLQHVQEQLGPQGRSLKVEIEGGELASVQSPITAGVGEGTVQEAAVDELVSVERNRLVFEGLIFITHGCSSPTCPPCRSDGRVYVEHVTVDHACSSAIGPVREALPENKGDRNNQNSGASE